ncbi:MAG: Na+/H+ antiporter NhaA [Rhodocyclaceae bacterium]|nr:Na+/H+ antiporter NhaA [Rhodocyclaceae bacterium]MBX3668991.1 Na+/H+ antiporter NhaA [Rhodocyclaceae bacterium]
MTRAEKVHAPYPLEPTLARALSPFESFLHSTGAGGILLMATTVLTLIVANSALGHALHVFWEQPAGLVVGDFAMRQSVHHWINDGLMALFFLLVGLELKREFMVGELKSPAAALLPIIAAAGGMAAPAAIYLAFNGGDAVAARGWGIPMGTDIAFAVGVLVLLGKRVPHALLIFLTALAIADDLGAVLVIALFYTSKLNSYALAAMALIGIVMLLANRAGLRHLSIWLLLGAALWYATWLSGMHATLAGILLAAAMPVRPRLKPLAYVTVVEHRLAEFRSHATDVSTPSDTFSSHDMAHIAFKLEGLTRAAQSPLQRTEAALAPWVSFAVLPIFAFANAGVELSAASIAQGMLHPVTLGIALGLLFGKFAGISAACWLAVRLRIARLPPGVTWPQLLGVAWLAGIGFTMALFIAQLAFTDPHLVEYAKLGILAASFVAAPIGVFWLLASTRKVD